jgi:FlaA1/EpsC-like NDP-sugar epimerase
LRNLVVWLLGRDRRVKQLLLMTADTFIVMFGAWLAYCIRLDTIYIPNQSQLVLILAAPFIAIPLFVGFGLYRSLIRYVGHEAIWSAFKAVGLTALLWGLLAFMTRAYGIEGVPRSVLVLTWLFMLLMVVSVRFLARWFLIMQSSGSVPRRHFLIYGAGEAARQIAATLQSQHPRLSVIHVTDDTSLIGSLIGGNPVYPAKNVPELVRRYEIKDAIVTLRYKSNAKRIDVVGSLRKQGLRVRILPPFADIVDGKHAVNMIREIEIGDLLGREMATPDKELMETNTVDKVVLITGAGGSIGSELCRQAVSLRTSKLVLLENSEVALYQIVRELNQKGDLDIVPILGSVTDQPLVKRILDEHRVNTVFHAAAYKHVPLVEANPFQGVINNALGTLSVATAAFESKVDVMVLVSTDKAVWPSGVMGASKRIAELIIQDFAARAKRSKVKKTFCAVRFGNVIGSSGSVIPLFREQIRNGGPLTLTDPAATRYFMTVSEAAQLVIQAGSIARPDSKRSKSEGDIYLLDMGEPVFIRDLAVKMIQLSNLTVCDEANPQGDIAIDVIGLRPGEKLHEVLRYSINEPNPTAHPKISVASEPPAEALDFDQLYSDLRDIASAQDHDRLIELLSLVTGLSRPDPEVESTTDESCSQSH